MHSHTACKAEGHGHKVQRSSFHFFLGVPQVPCCLDSALDGDVAQEEIHFLTLCALKMLYVALGQL